MVDATEVGGGDDASMNGSKRHPVRASEDTAGREGGSWKNSFASEVTLSASVADKAGTDTVEALDSIRDVGECWDLDVAHR